jgi:hypothetical protein
VEEYFEARFLRMNQCTRQLRDAQNKYWSVLHRAQDEHAIRSESDQASNFRDHESDGYNASTIRKFGCPMPEKKSSVVEQWISGIGKNVETPPTPPIMLTTVKKKESGLIVCPV